MQALAGLSALAPAMKRGSTKLPVASAGYRIEHADISALVSDTYVAIVHAQWLHAAKVGSGSCGAFACRHLADACTASHFPQCNLT